MPQESLTKELEEIRLSQEEKEKIKNFWTNINDEIKLLGAVIKNLDSTKIMNKMSLAHVFRRLNNIIRLCSNEENQKISNVDYSHDFKDSLDDVKNNFWALDNSLNMDKITDVAELEKQYFDLLSGNAFLGLSNLVKRVS